MAARRPPALRGIVTHCSTDDRYTEDAHFSGGCINDGMFSWGSSFFTLLGLPPDPRIVGDRWRAMWRSRLEAVDLDLATWLRHPTRDDFWRHGSVNEDYARISCPVFAVGGLLDSYTNTVPRLLENLSTPVRGLIGPWGHQTPDGASPGPGLGFHELSLEWWRDCLGTPSAQPVAARLTLFVADETPRQAIDAGRQDVAGRWIELPEWPHPAMHRRSWTLAPGTLVAGSAPRRVLELSPDPRCGLDVGTWLPSALEDELPREQSREDARSLVFDGEPLDEALQLIGRARLDVELSADREDAQLVARLCELRPDGTSWLVTKGALNLARRGGLDRSLPVAPGRLESVTLDLDFAAHRFLAGSRLRLALQSGCFPLLWPSPHPVTLRIASGSSRLDLPTLAAGEGRAVVDLPAPLVTPPALRVDDAGSYRRTIEESGDAVVVTTESDGGRLFLTDTETAVERWSRQRFVLPLADPAATSVDLERRFALTHEDWRPRVETHIRVEGTGRELRLQARLEAHEGERPVHAREYEEVVPRVGF